MAKIPIFQGALTLDIARYFGWWPHPLYYLIWTVILPQPYESAWLRFASGISFIPFIFYRHYPVRFRPWLNLCWYLWLTFTLPVIFTFLMLMNDLSGMWLVCQTMMFLVFALGVPNFFLMMFLLIAGISIGYLGFVWTTGSHLVLTTEIIEYMLPIPMAMLLVILFHITIKKGEVAMKGKLLQSLAGGIAHEMRNPLGQVRHTLNTIQHQLPVYHPERPVESWDEQALDQVYQGVAHGQMAVKRGVQVIDMMLDQVHDKPIDPDRFVYLSAARTTRKALDEYGYDSPAERERVHLEDGQEFTFRGDETLYLFVLFNLLKNAFYYLKTAPDSEIFLRLERGESDNRLHFKDTGPGIAKENLDHLFDNFFTAGKQGGTGLGLAYCKRVMRAFGGDITCDSVLGEFTAFTLSFPAVTEQEQATDQARIIAEARPELQGKRLLVVDDEPLHRELVKQHLSPLEVVIDEASNGREAVEQVRGAHYDLILMDLNMPEMNGYQATERLRAGAGGPYGQTTPILAHTSEPPYIAQGKTEKVGMQGLLAKPCTPPELIVAVRDAIKRGAPSPSQTLTGKAVLVVDDSEFNRLIIKEGLEGKGIEVLEAAAGEAAIAVLEEHPCDLVLMDIQMPGMDGLEATRRIRTSRTVPIIGLSGESEAEQIRAAREAGMDDYLVKPIDQAVLLRKMEAWLSPPALPDADNSQGSVPVDGQESSLGLDFDEGARRLGVDRRRLEAMLPALLRDHEDIPRRVREAQVAGDYRAIQGWAHKVKGACSYLGAEALRAQAEALERRIREEGTAPAAEVEGFADGLHKTLDAIRRLV